ncbi:GNAT family N-acetyltransferase [Enterococcus raffinosus]|uniref:GNAT family N-acetyltransferase n=1 Tax=Enterococcus raffinosus TaxID=71452 RepID=UPI0028FD4F7D|nr:GNAT family N-acetyltransferase [Enterococcus raffinosus]
MGDYVTLTEENIANEHLCCAISGKKHQAGVDTKRAWLSERLSEGHVFRKLDANGKVFIEYAPLETAWVPVVGENYLYIYCLWVSGSFKRQGHGKNLLQSCIDDAKRQNKSGVCVISSQKKTPFLTDKKFVEKQGFKVVDQIEGGYELLALSFDGTVPAFSETARQQTIDNQTLTIFYGQQCPFIPNGLKEVQAYCEEEAIPLTLIPVDSLEKAKNLPGIFNNWDVYYRGKFLTIHMLNKNVLKKLLAGCEERN